MLVRVVLHPVKTKRALARAHHAQKLSAADLTRFAVGDLLGHGEVAFAEVRPHLIEQDVALAIGEAGSTLGRGSAS